MQFRILRGSHQIGGSCVQVQAMGQSILIDLGLPLDVMEPDPKHLPDVEGLVDGANPDLIGIVLSHAHGDHSGLLPLVRPELPVFMGEGTHRMLQAAAQFVKHSFLPDLIAHFCDRETFQVGPFNVTPFLTDHSAFDAYSLLIEADGKRLFYSGDFRTHGRKGSLVDRLCRKPPADIDVLLLEGTILSRRVAATPQSSERDLEEDILATMKATNGLVLTWFSPQNIDRFVTFFRAAKRAGRKFVADAYLANILDAIALNSLPSPLSNDMRIFLPQAQKHRIVRDKRFDLVEPYRSNRIFLPELMAQQDRFVMLFRPSMIGDLQAHGDLSEATLIYSLWPGYLTQESFDIRAWCAQANIVFEIHHTSGHADLETLKMLAQALDPRTIVPIHTDVPERYSEHFSNVKRRKDGEWCRI